MSVHDVIAAYQKSVQEVLDQDKRQESLRFLPGLSEGLRRLTKQIRETHPDHVLWTQVYGQSAVPEAEAAQSLTQDLIAILDDSEAVLHRSANQIVQLSSQAGDAERAWGSAHTKLADPLKAFRQEWKSEINSLQAVTRIPDLVAPAEKKTVNDQTTRLAQFLSLNLAGQPRSKVAAYAKQWQTLVEQFDQMKQQLSFDAIAQTYQLSPDTIAVLEDLVSGNPVSLAQVSPQTLEELRRFQHFCESVTLRLST